jgi:hypothetical protein
MVAQHWTLLVNTLKIYTAIIHGKDANTKIKFPQHLKDQFVGSTGSGRHVGLKTTP